MAYDRVGIGGCSYVEVEVHQTMTSPELARFNKILLVLSRSQPSSSASGDLHIGWTVRRLTLRISLRLG